LVDRQRAAAHHLMPLEIQVLSLLGRGLTMKEVAQKLDTTIRTIAYHRFILMERLALSTTEELIAFAKEIGLDAFLGEN